MANNTHLTKVDLSQCNMNDRKISSLFLGLRRSNTIKEMDLYSNYFGTAGARSLVPFLQNANNLTQLELAANNIQSEGFNMLFRSLRNSPIETLNCSCCGIESIDIDIEHAPRNVKDLFLWGNSIDANGCHELAKLLQGGDATLRRLSLNENEIDDDGVEILVEALQNNTALTELNLEDNEDISKQGEIMLLKLVNDTSSIEATMQSNHTLTKLHVIGTYRAEEWVAGDEIQRNIDFILLLNITFSERGPIAVGKEKIIRTQLNSARRVELRRLQEQEVEHFVFSEIDPLHLPEVLSVVGRRHGQGELYVAMLSSIMSLFSTMDRERCIQQEKENYVAKIAEHKARLKELDNELAAIRESAVRTDGNVAGNRRNKRRRT